MIWEKIARNGIILYNLRASAHSEGKRELQFCDKIFAATGFVFLEVLKVLIGIARPFGGFSGNIGRVFEEFSRILKWNEERQNLLECRAKLLVF
jgi:hypothetical protein